MSRLLNFHHLTAPGGAGGGGSAAVNVYTAMDIRPWTVGRALFGEAGVGHKPWVSPTARLNYEAAGIATTYGGYQMIPFIIDSSESSYGGGYMDTSACSWNPHHDEAATNGFANGAVDPNTLYDGVRIVWWVQDANNTYQGYSASVAVAAWQRKTKGGTNWGGGDFYAGRYEMSPQARWQWGLRVSDGEGVTTVSAQNETAWNYYNDVMVEFIPGTHIRASRYATESAPSNFGLPSTANWAAMPNECKVDCSSGALADLGLMSPAFTSSTSSASAENPGSPAGRHFGAFIEWRAIGHSWEYLK